MAWVCAASFGAPVVPPVWNSAARSAERAAVADEAGRVGVLRRPRRGSATVTAGQERQRLGGRGRAARGGPQRPGRCRACRRRRARGLCPGGWRELGPGRDEHPGSGTAQQFAEVRGCDSAPLSGAAMPGQLRGQGRGDQLGAVGGQQRDRVAAPHAQLVQQVGVPVDVGEQLARRCAARGCCQRSASGRTETATRSGHSVAARSAARTWSRAGRGPAAARTRSRPGRPGWRTRATAARWSARCSSGPPHGGALRAEVDARRRRWRSSASTTSPSLQVRGFLRLALRRTPSTSRAGGSSEPMISIGLAGALQRGADRGAGQHQVARRRGAGSGPAPAAPAAAVDHVAADAACPGAARR